MKNITIILTIVILGIGGCKNKHSQSSPEKVSKELVDSFKKLDQEAIDITLRDRWFAERLDAALTKLEQYHGLETPIFDLGKATDKIPYSSIPGFKPKIREFYAPYPILVKSNSPTKYESYIYSEALTSHINMQMRIREPDHFATDKYAQYLEERMKRLEKYIGEPNDANTVPAGP